MGPILLSQAGQDAIVVRAVRISGWFLLAWMVLYVISGYALAEEFGCDRILSEALATDLHANGKLDRLLVVFLAVRAFGATVLALRRRGWIKPRGKT